MQSSRVGNNKTAFVVSNFNKDYRNYKIKNPFNTTRDKKQNKKNPRLISHFYNPLATINAGQTSIITRWLYCYKRKHRLFSFILITVCLCLKIYIYIYKEL